MKIDRYPDEVARLCLRWRERLLRESTEALADSCRAFEMAGLFQLDHLNKRILDELAYAPARRREELLRHAPDEQHRLALMILACWRVRSPHHLLQVLSETGTDSSANLSTKEMALRASWAADTLQLPLPFWPFEDLPDPLGGEEQ